MLTLSEDARAHLPPLPPADALARDPAYLAALDYLYGLSAVVRPSAAIRADQPRKIPRMRHLLALWADPQRHYPAVLVAGTKGKGSTAAMLAAVLRAAGWRVGRYTQPHLVSYRERVWIDGTHLSAASVSALAAEVRPLVEQAERRRPELGRYTTFEAGTALALTAFARAGVELAVIEVGVGGTRDATNVLEPVVSAIAPISADHLATLGPTLADVARAKAGVMRRGRPAAIGPQCHDVATVLAAAAATTGAIPTWVGVDWRWQPAGGDPAPGGFTVVGPHVQYRDLVIPLLGRHQRDNATLAIATAEATIAALAAPVRSAPGGSGGSARRDEDEPAPQPHLHYGGELAEPPQPVRPGRLGSAIARGLAAMAWPGRIQLLPTTPPLVVDGAHNAASAARLRETLAESFPGQPLVLVLGCTDDKDVQGIAAQLVPLATSVIATRAHHPRAAPTTMVADAVRAAGAAVQEIAEAAAALDVAAARCPQNGLIVVAGSVFVAGEALRAVGATGAWEG
jgi:dihydrofolate synthase/folylpolyglutamate synthase